MTTAQLPTVAEMYDALARRDSAFEGVFVVGVKTTGICCRPTCPARKPKPENVEYFPAVRDALLAGYRPCRRCHPLESAGAPPIWLRSLIEEVEADPARRWRDRELVERGLEPARVRRWFQREHGMTFHAYQRARRLGTALGRIKDGAELLDAGYEAGFASPSGFRDAFGKLFGQPPGKGSGARTLLVTRFTTPLGPMIAAATDRELCLLEFVDRRMLQTQIDRLRSRLEAHFVPGKNEVLERTEVQIGEYFTGRRQDFDIPLLLPGTEFQVAAWRQLRTVPYGKTRTYAEQAHAIGRPKAVRAVGRANGDNRIAIIVPCHRVVGANGALTGYGGQMWRKKALLEREQGAGLFS